MGWWGCAKRKEFNQKSPQKQPTSAQNRPKICPKSVQNRFRTVQNRSKIGPGSAKIRLNTARQHQNGAAPTGPAHFCQKCGQHGRNLGSQNEPKSLKNQSKNRSNFELLLGSSLDPKIVPKTTQKSIKNRSKIDLKSEQAKKNNMFFFKKIIRSGGTPYV